MKLLKDTKNDNVDFDIDISQIDIEDLKRGYRDLRLTPTSVSYGDKNQDSK